MEIWKDIKGYEGYYQVSNLGSVKSLNRNVKSTKKYQTFYKSINERILKTDIKKGYKYVVLNKEGFIKKYAVHRLVALSFINNQNDKKQVNHIDGNKLNNLSSNLEWCSAKENKNHAIRIGLININGSKHHNSKLNESDVYKIKFEHNNISLTEIGKIYNISKYVVWGIKKGKSWKHVLKKSSIQP